MRKSECATASLLPSLHEINQQNKSNKKSSNTKPEKANRTTIKQKRTNERTNERTHKKPKNVHCMYFVGYYLGKSNTTLHAMICSLLCVENDQSD